MVASILITVALLLGVPIAISRKPPPGPLPNPIGSPIPTVRALSAGTPPTRDTLISIPPQTAAPNWRDITPVAVLTVPSSTPTVYSTSSPVTRKNEPTPEELAYLNYLETKFTLIGRSMARIAELSRQVSYQPAILHDPQWNLQIKFSLNELKSLARELQSYDQVPERCQLLSQRLRIVSDDLNYIADQYPASINEMDVSHFQNVLDRLDKLYSKSRPEAMAEFKRLRFE